MEEGKEVLLVVCSEESDGAPIFDINTGEKILYIPDCHAPPSGLASIAGRLLVASRSNKDKPVFEGAIYFWDPDKLHETHKSCIGEAIVPIACSKDGMYLVGGAHSGNAYLWEVTSGALLKCWRAHEGAISCLSFSYDSSLVISAYEQGTAHVWCMISLLQAEEHKSHEDIKYNPNLYTVQHDSSITGIITILASSCPVLITSSVDGSCKITELIYGRLVHMLTLSSPITATTIDPLEQLLICGASDSAIYFTALNGIRMQYSVSKICKDDCQVLYGHKAPISALALSSEGVWLASGSKDCVVLIWDTRTWNAIRKLENRVGSITNLLVIPKPEMSMVCIGNHLALEIPTLEKIFKPTNETTTLFPPFSFSKDAYSTHACSGSSNHLTEQIVDLEGKRTPEATEMIVAMSVDEQIRSQDLAKGFRDTNSILQYKALNVMEARESLH